LPIGLPVAPLALLPGERSTDLPVAWFAAQPMAPPVAPLAVPPVALPWMLLLVLPLVLPVVLPVVRVMRFFSPIQILSVRRE